MAYSYFQSLLPPSVCLSGFYSIVSSINGHFEVAAVMIAVAFVCDGLDGRVARASRTSSEFGVEYDSLSDVVAFGVAPACLAYTWALKPLNGIGIVIAGMFVVCGALRLARFNIQTETVDKNRFVGLPIPGAAALIAGTALVIQLFRTRIAADADHGDGADHAGARPADDLASSVPQLQDHHGS